jgi:hypothetical protein
MAPWPEWQFEYVGTRFLGKLLGQWTTLWVSLIRRLFRLLLKAAKMISHGSRSLKANPRSSSGI